MQIAQIPSGADMSLAMGMVAAETGLVQLSLTVEDLAAAQPTKVLKRESFRSHVTVFGLQLRDPQMSSSASIPRSILQGPNSQLHLHRRRLS